MKAKAPGGGERRGRPRREEDADDLAEREALEEHRAMLVTTQKRKKWTTDELLLFSEAFRSEAHAMEALTRYARERECEFNVKRRHVWKDGMHESVCFTCVHNRVKFMAEKRCNAMVTLHLDHDRRIAKFVEKSSCLEHNGHPAKVRNDSDDADAVFADFLNLSYGMLSDDMRCEWFDLFPDRELPGTGSSSNTPRELHMPGMPYYYQWATSQFYTEKFTSERVIRDVTPIASVEAFAAELSTDGDRDYLKWWMKHTDASSVVFLKMAPGVTPVNLQMSLSFFQQRCGVLDNGHKDSKAARRHAVFSSSSSSKRALLAINVYALRSYRVMSSCHYIQLKSSMPIAPLLLQAWAMRPTNEGEQCARRLGMMSTLMFIGECVSKELCSPKAMISVLPIYGVNEPQFELYDFLPEFLNVICTSESSMRNQLYMTACLDDRTDACFSALVASFILQKEDHYICEDTLSALRTQFGSGPFRNELRNKYPHAAAAIDFLHDRHGDLVRAVGKKILTPMYIASWDEVSLWPWLQRPGVESQPHFYIYQLCFEEKFLDMHMRVKIANGITIDGKLAPSLSATPRGLGAPREQKRGMQRYKNRAAPYLRQYHGLFEKSVDPNTARFFTPFSSEKRDLWPLNTLFALLKSLDFLRRNKIEEAKTPEEEKMLTPEQVSGPLYIGDPAKTCLRQINWPVSCVPSKDGGDVSHFENTLWVWDGHYHAKANPSAADIAAVEACLLVRDPCYYFQKEQCL
jgi:hypothetical protein